MNYKNHHYEVTQFGKAKYKFDDRNNESYFVSYKNKNGDITTIWSKELEKVINENDVKVGEFVKFQKVDKVPIERTIRKKAVNGKREVFTKTSFKDVWDCSIIGRNEKNLQVNKTKNQTKYKSEIVELTDLEKKNAEFLKMKKQREAKQGLNIQTQGKGKFGYLRNKEELER